MSIKSLLQGNRVTWIAAACLIPVLLAGLSLFAYNVTMTAWNAVVKYPSPYLFEDLVPQPATGNPATDGVLLIIVDGLRLDSSGRLATWNAARQGLAPVPAGADFVATAGQPSLSDPAAAVIPSGTTQEIHGVTTNWYEGRLKVDNLFTAARRSGKTTAVVAGKGWVDLYGDSIDAMYKFDDAADDFDEKVFEQTMDLLEAAREKGPEALPDLLIVHFGGVDGASHDFGGTSPQALEAAKTIDGYVGQILAAYDLQSCTAILTADHGHIATGGHGGWETEVVRVPLVFSGKAVNSGGKGQCDQVDIAPTVCALLGMSPPAETVGHILEDAVTLPPEDLAKASIALGRARYAFTQTYLAVVGSRLAYEEDLPRAIEVMVNGNKAVDEAWAKLVAGRTDEAAAKAREGADLMDQARDLVAATRMRADAAARLWRVLLAAGLGFLPLIYLAWNRWFWPAVAGTALYFAGYNALFFLVHGYWWSLSIFNEESMVQSFFNTRMLEAVGVVLLIGLGLGLVAGWRKKYNGPELAQGAATLSYLVAYLIGLQVLIFYRVNGIHFGWFLPDLRTGFKFYIDLLQMVPTGLAAFLVVLITLLGAKLAVIIGGVPAAPPAKAGGKPRRA